MIKRLVCFAVGFTFLYALLDNEWEPFLELVKIFGAAGAVLVGYAVVVWVSAHTIRSFVRMVQRLRE